MEENQIKPEPKKEPCIQYDFIFAERTIPVILWPKRGDTIGEGSYVFTFTFPRLGITQTIYKTYLHSTLVLETTRVYIDVKQAKELLREKQEADRKERERSEARQQVPSTRGRFTGVSPQTGSTSVE